ncbi:50S ribosomal protein L28 [Porphyromonadaceae bacterium W3.11]|nr:50S ribosomal protein L28 [Porphyromonadaceae bacterium W3.11]
MSRICQITGKKAMVGNKVSHSLKRTKHTFNANLFDRKFYWPEQDCWIQIRVSAAGLRLINKIGLNAALINAEQKGFLKEYKILDM